MPIPSRTGLRGSNRYRFLGKVDGLSEGGGVRIVEFKLRDRLTPLWLLVTSRQLRWYAWAYQQATGTRVDGVIVEERLKVAPKPPRILINGKPSHSKDQHTTPELYRAVCQELGVEPDPDTELSFAQRIWGQRQPITFRAWRARGGRP